MNRFGCDLALCLAVLLAVFGVQRSWSQSICPTGLSQSPIDITEPFLQSSSDDGYYAPTMTTNYTSLYNSSLLADGYLEVLYNEEGSSFDLKLNEWKFHLAQFHFHTPSEHDVKGVQYPAEIHLVHVLKTNTSQVAVIGIFVDVSNDTNTKANPVLQAIIDRIPKLNQTLPTNQTIGTNQTLPTNQTIGTNDTVSVTLNEDVNPTALFPEDRSYYHYNGSLTVAPCTEGIMWFLFETPILVPKSQMNSIYAALGNNSRHLEPRNNRTISYWNANRLNASRVLLIVFVSIGIIISIAIIMAVIVLKATRKGEREEEEKRASKYRLMDENQQL